MRNASLQRLGGCLVQIVREKKGKEKKKYMEGILQGLQSNETSNKVHALEETIQKLENNPRLFAAAPTDVRVRLISTTVHLIKDSNPKVVVLSLNCVNIFIEKYPEYFHPLTNLTFDSVMTKLGDSKQQIRTKAVETFLFLFTHVGLTAGYQKLAPLISTKNSRLREQILLVVQHLLGMYGRDMAALPELGDKIYPLLKDPVESIRQIAIQLCGSLLKYLGESVLANIQEIGIKNKALLQSIQAASLSVPTIITESEDQSLDDDDGNGFDSRETLFQSTSLKNSPSGHASTLKLTSGNSRPLSFDGRTSDKSPMTSPASRSTPTLDAEFPSRVGSSSSVGTDHSGNTANITKYLPSQYLGLLGDGQCNSPICPASEQEFSRVASTIQAELSKKDDWQARQNGLLKLQALTKGVHESPYLEDGSNAADLFITFARSIHELIAVQISDLRSAISKEASRAVAIMSRVLKSQFSPFAELWLPSLLKLLLIKIQVILSAADRCIRAIILSGTPNGYPRVLQLLLENLSSKSALVRKYCYEYLTLSVICWESDVPFERNSVNFKKAIQLGVNDADSQARKTARVLFWLMKQRSNWRRSLESILDLFDASTKKHVESEQHQAEYVEISKNLGILSNIDLYDLDWKDTDVPQLSRNGSLSSSGRLSVGSDILSSRSEDDDELRKPIERPVSARVPNRVAAMSPIQIDSQTKQEENEESHPGIDEAREKISSLKSKRAAAQLVSTKLGKPGIGHSCRRLPVGVAKSTAREPGDMLEGAEVDLMASRAPLSSSITAKSSKAPLTNQPVSTSREFTYEEDGEELDQSSRNQVTRGGTALNTGPQRVMMAPQRVLSEPNKPSQVNERPPLRVQRSAQSLVSTDNLKDDPGRPSTSSIRASIKSDKEKNFEGTGGMQSSLAPSSISVAEIKVLLADSLWTKRVTGLEAVSMRFKKWISTSSSDSVHPIPLEELLDLTIKALADPNQRVSTEAHQTLEILGTTQNSLIASRLGVLLPILFNRLGDRKPIVKTQANEMLDSLRQVHDPCTLMAILSPKIPEVPERTLISIVQYLITIAPLCGSYFIQPSNTGAFLNRMALVLSTHQGRRPSSSLILSGHRLLDLVYKTSAEVVLGQLSTLPLQHQAELKKIFIAKVPNLDTLMNSVGKEFPPNSSLQEEYISTNPVRSSLIHELDDPVQIHEDSDDPEEESQLEDSHQISREFIHSPIERNGYNPQNYSNSSPMQTLKHSASPQYLSPSPITSGFYETPIQSIPPNRVTTPPASPLSSTPKERIALESPQKAKDIVWLIQTLRSDGGACREEKKKAIVELKRLAKVASEDYWKRNCAQVISVLLEAFTPPGRNFYDPLLPLSTGIKAMSDSYFPPTPLTGLSPLGEMTAKIEYLFLTGTDRERSHQALLEEEIYLQRMESMHVACKGLLILIKVLGGNHIKAFLELIVCRLCQAVSYTPVAITLHFQEILSLISALDPSRIILLLLPYVSPSSSTLSPSPVSNPLNESNEESNQQIRLLALQTLSHAIPHLSSPQLLELLSAISSEILPYFTSPSVDIRKAVVFVYVEIYMIVGDALYPYVRGLAASQRKLLTVYIERQMNRSSVPVSMPYDV